MAAMQESSLRNLNGGDRDSMGLFQQRPSQGWGSPQQVTDPIYASRKFFSALQGVRNRNNMTLAQAAQTVQKSAYPSAYADRENDARRMLNFIGVKGGLPWPVQTPQMDLNDHGIMATQPEQPTIDVAGQTQAAGVGASTDDPSSPSAAGAGASTDPVILPPTQQAPVDPDLTPGLNNGFPALTGLAGGGARDKVIEAALSRRHVFATKSPTLQLLVAGNETLMGARLALPPDAPLDIDIWCEDAAANRDWTRLELWTNGGTLVEAWETRGLHNLSRRISVPPGDAGEQWYVVRIMREGGSLAYSSPVWARWR
jgi:hypothetical protein